MRPRGLLDLFGFCRSHASNLVLQHRFAIGVFEGLSHTGGMVNRAGQFGVSWKSAGGLCHGYDRAARSGDTVAEVA